MKKNKIAIVDDEPDILELVSLNLNKENFEVDTFLDGKSFINYLKNNTPDLIVLDIMLPDSDGFEICKYIRKQNDFNSIPIIILSAKGEIIDKVLGLELGADDYVAKPFSPKELTARIKAVLRRKGSPEQKSIIKIADSIKIDIDRYKVLINDKKINLTTTEFNILKLLAENKGRVYSRDQILDHLWGNKKFVLDRTIDVHIRNLRKKFGEYSYIIKNIRAVGYKVDDEEEK